MNERVNLEIYRLEVIKGKMGKADGLEKKKKVRKRQRWSVLKFLR